MKLHSKGNRTECHRLQKRLRVSKGRKAMTFEQAHRGCVDKTTFHSRKTVKKAAKNKGLRYYKCDFCGEWHLTSKKYKGSFKP